MKQLKDWFLALLPVLWAIRISKHIVLPGFNGIPVYDVAVFFYRGLSKGYITLRVSAISYNFFPCGVPFSDIPFYDHSIHPDRKLPGFADGADP